MPAAEGFLRGLRALCDRHDALLVLDEIQCGMGRTGTLFAHWHDAIKPDIVTLAKALGGGFPIGAMLAGAKVAEVMQFGAHGTTFGGNPLAASVARVALRKLSSAEIAANVARQSAALRAGLAAIDDELKLFDEVRGRGLMLGAVLVDAHKGNAGAILDAAASAWPVAAAGRTRRAALRACAQHRRRRRDRRPRATACGATRVRRSKLIAFGCRTSGLSEIRLPYLSLRPTGIGTNAADARGIRGAGPRDRSRPP